MKHTLLFIFTALLGLTFNNSLLLKLNLMCLVIVYLYQVLPVDEVMASKPNHKGRAEG